jgi:hypothetical protein
MTDCPHCGRTFVNDMEVDEHVSQVHADKWRGGYLFGENGDENAEGAVSPVTADTLATRGGRERPNARERAEQDTKTP